MADSATKKRKATDAVVEALSVAQNELDEREAKLQEREEALRKAIEGVDTAELSDAELTSQLYAAAAASEVAQPAITKAAPKGGRRLVKRTNKPIDVTDS